MAKKIQPQAPGLLQQPPLAKDTAVQGAVVQSAKPVQAANEHFAGRLLDAAQARDLNAVKHLVTSWTQAQSSYEALSDGLLALSNFLRVFGSGESDPKLYANLLALEPPKAGTLFDPATLELAGPKMAQTGKLLKVVEMIAAAVGKGLLDKSIDVNAGDNLALKNILIASNLGLATDALKVKMAGWNKLTKQLDQATVSFELGIRKLPKGTNTNFWVVGGVSKAVDWVKSLRVSPSAVEWMKNDPLFSGYPKAFFEYFTAPTDGAGERIQGGLSQFEKDIRSVKIDALPDGEVYAGGPIMRVSGPPAAVEFLETNLMRLVTSWTTVATAAAQMTLGADGKPVAYFGPRRAPGGDDSTLAISNAAALGGMTVSSDLLGGFLGNPMTGTMEHSIMLMLKTVLKHDPPRSFSAAERKDASELLSATLRAATPGADEKQIDEKVKGLLEDVLAEAYIFQEYSMKYDRAKSVALVDTTDPNVGVAAAMLAQKWAWAAGGKTQENNLFAVRLDSGNLLAQGLQFSRVLKEQGMQHINVMATDGLLPETVRFFEKVEDHLHAAAGQPLPESFRALIQGAPASVAEDEAERKEILVQAEQLSQSGGLDASRPLFKGYGAGEKIADSVSTVGRPGIVYKASQLTFPGADGNPLTVNMGKIPTPDKATGPNRELVGLMAPDGKRFVEYAIISPEELKDLGSGWQRLMRTVFEDGQSKVNTSHKAGIEHGAQRRAQLPEGVADGAAVRVGMSQGYKDAWAAVVRDSDPTREAEFRAYFDSMWPTVSVTG